MCVVCIGRLHYLSSVTVKRLELGGSDDCCVVQWCRVAPDREKLTRFRRGRMCAQQEPLAFFKGVNFPSRCKGDGPRVSVFRSSS